MLKKNIRKEFLEKRKRLSLEALQEKTALIIDQFANLELLQIKQLLSHSPLADRQEFDVSQAEQLVKRKNREVQIAWPKLSFDNSLMEAIPVGNDTLFVKNKYNILEPLVGDPVNPLLIDLVFVPLIAFDLNGYRVGFGKGYYDRYLSRCRPETIKFGFSFFEAIDLIEDINEFDVPLNFCISPTRIYEF